MTPSPHASQYPAPPDGQDPHYTPLYPSTQVLDGLPPRVAYPQEAGFPKLDNINEVLQAQQALQANHALSAPQQSKPNRLRKACDSCSIRKCDESGPPCRACVALEIPCTFERPSRRRGPPNRHAEAIKKRRIGGGDFDSGGSTPQSPTNAAHALAQLQSSHASQPQLSAEEICALPTLNALIDDFFSYIHPLCPFPHEPSFRQAWARREDLTNPSFLALLASMLAVLVASFPRTPRLHLTSQTRREYPNHLSLVDKCRHVCARARGPGYLDRPTLNVYDACTSYFLGLAGAYIFKWRQLRLYFAECLTIIRALGLHKPESQGLAQGGTPAAWGANRPNQDGPVEPKVDYITEEIARRVFWTVFVGARTIQQLGASYGELVIAPATPTEPLPPLPREVDDVHIFPNEIQPQQEGVVSMMTGFNINVRIYLSYSSLATAEMAFGIDEIFDWERQQRIFEQSLQRCRQILVSLPEVLKVQPKTGRDFEQQKPYYPPMPEYSDMRSPATNNPSTSEARDSRRYEIQKANIYASHLATRSHLVEKYFLQSEKYHRTNNTTNVLAAGIDRFVPATIVDAEALEKAMAEEREQVVKDLLVVLGSIDMVNMEPNGDSFVSLKVYLHDPELRYAATKYSVSSTSFDLFDPSAISPIASLRFIPIQTQKIRQIASTLLEVPKERRGSVALKHQDYLYKFLDILSKLERVSPEASDPNNGALDEESELRLWADLRDHQLRFQEQGGVYGFS
ncbi:Fungal-trans multi-domain protein [Pyrenophora tritici-repentis]|nr:Fungal-trans multi-domain protein [Pyrenophora tritici-repentis]